MEDCVVSEFRQLDDIELGLFAIFDGHLGHDVANFLQNHLFDNILKEVIVKLFHFFFSFWNQCIYCSTCLDFFLCYKLLFHWFFEQPGFWSDAENAIKRAYRKTDDEILAKSFSLGRGGSTAVTAILINGRELVVANVGDSRAVMSENGVAKQLSVDHEPSSERRLIESRGGFVSNLPGT